MTTPTPSVKPWPDYRAVWRWHFYAGLICIPFVMLLAITGTIYIYRPQIEHWIDRPYDHFTLNGPPATAEARVKAALAAVPGSTFDAYELPKSPEAAAQVLVTKGGEQTRVYVHPETLQIFKMVKESDRFVNVIFYLHGELLMKNPGSMIVESAASWAIIMMITGLYLWWPRQGRGLAGVLYPRLDGGGRLFWRDLHAVTGVWISGLVLFILLTGLPWAYLWGNYLKEFRALTHTDVAVQQWPVGHDEPAAAPAESSGHAAHHGGAMPGMAMPDDSSGHAPVDYAALDTMVAAVAPLHLPPPVLISPPGPDSRAWLGLYHENWTARSDTQNRPQRVTLTLDNATGAVLKREGFRDEHPIDQIVDVGVAAHEGQLFGWPNQLLNTLTAFGLLLLCVSAAVMWWRRRAQGVLGAPEPLQRPRFAIGLGLIVLALAIYLPLFGLSMIMVKLAERFVFSRIPSVRNWLGLTPAISQPKGGNT